MQNLLEISNITAYNDAVIALYCGLEEATAMTELFLRYAGTTRVDELLRCYMMEPGFADQDPVIGACRIGVRREKNGK